MESGLDPWAAKAALEWQIDMGADEALLDQPVDRYGLAPQAPKAAPAGRTPAEAVPPQASDVIDPVAEATRIASAAPDLPGLAAAMEAFDHCALKRGARSFVFADGNPAARVMVIGEAPGRDEDREGRPFVGRAGQLLDRMLGAIGLDRAAPEPAKSVYITNVLPWRPPQNRAPEPAEIAMLLPFLQAHVALADPEIVVLMGNTPCQALLGRAGITRIRGQWQEVLGKPAMPMFHPAYLLRQPHAKREAWADLLEIRARLEAGS